MRHVKAVHVPHALTCERCKTKCKTRSNLNRHRRQRRGFCNATKEETNKQTATTDTPRKSDDADEGRRILRYDGEEEEENAQEVINFNIFVFMAHFFECLSPPTAHGLIFDILGNLHTV